MTATIQSSRERGVRGSKEGGFTLIEIMIAISVLIVISMIAIPKFVSAMHNARVVKAISAVKKLSREIVTYRTKNQMVFPASLASMGTRTLFDPWNNPYQFVVLERSMGIEPTGNPRVDGEEKPLNTDFDVYSRGVNGLSRENITDPHSIDDIVRGRNGGFFGIAKKY